MALPIFVDESLHILRAQMVFDFSDPTASFLPGKVLLYYFIGFFGPQDANGAWLARQAVALLTLPGAALTYRLALTLYRRRAVGLWAVGLYALTPFLVFFERLALADTFMMVWGLGVAVAALHFAHRPTPRSAQLIGALLGLSLLAKLTALPWLVLPPLAVWLFGGRPVRSLRREWVNLYGIMLLMLALPVLYAVYQTFFPPTETQEVVTTTLFVPDERGRLAQITHNLTVYAEAATVMFTLPLTVLMVGLGAAEVWQRRAQAFFLLVMAGALWGFIALTSAQPSTRYLVAGVPPLLILLAAGLLDAYQALSRWFQQRGVEAFRYPLGWAVAAMLLIMLPWGVQGLTFIWHSWQAPDQLNLPERDIWEYYQNATTGYALRAAARDLPSLPPLQEDGQVRVAGFVAACHTLRLYLPPEAPVEVECPYFKWRPEFADQTLTTWQARLQAGGAWYFLADDEQPLDLSQLAARWELLATYPRPHDGVTTRLYRVTALASD